MEKNSNLLLTEREGGTGEYWPEVVAVRIERSAARTLLDFSNSLPLSMLNGYFFSDKYRCILR